MVTFGAQVHVKGILGGTEEAGRHIGYLTKYLTKGVGQAAGLDEHHPRHRDHALRLPAELAITPCSRAARSGCSTASNPRVPDSLTAGPCKARRTSPNTSASPDAASSSPASGPTRACPTTAPSGPRSFGNCSKAGVQPGYAVDDGPFEWETTQPGDTDVPPGPCCCSTRSTNDSDGEPTTTPPLTTGEPPETVRQLTTKPPDGEGDHAEVPHRGGDGRLPEHL